jgi:hypothetical protein
VSDYDPVTPQAGRYLVLPNRWIRTFVFLDQRPGELDRLSMWVADETTPPVLIFDNRTVSVRGTPPTVAQFWVELNTSQDDYRGSLAPLVSYVRNFVALKDVGSALPFLQQPGASKPITLQRPNAPTNVRIVPPFFQ